MKTNNTSNKQTTHEAITQRITEHLKNGQIPWRKAWSNPPRNLESGRRYNGVNWALLGMAEFENPFFLTFKQARELGGHVRKGEKGSMVVYCGTAKDKRFEAASDDEERKYRFLKRYWVFNLEQCENIPTDSIPAVPKNDFEPIEEAERVLKGWSDSPEIMQVVNRAFFKRDAYKIGMPPKASFASAEQYYRVLFHELTHTTGHASRLNRPQSEDDCCPIYWQEELVAELGAAFLCSHCGFLSYDLEQQNAAYIKQYLSLLQNDPKAFCQAASAAQKAVSLILGEAGGKEAQGAGLMVEAELVAA